MRPIILREPTPDERTASDAAARGGADAVHLVVAAGDAVIGTADLATSDLGREARVSLSADTDRALEVWELVIALEPERPLYAVPTGDEAALERAGFTRMPDDELYVLLPAIDGN